jgi:hypothetical protein
MKNILPVVVLVGLGACGGGSSPTPSRFARVDYLVTGTATRASMTYATSNGGTAQQADRPLPWAFDTVLNQGDFVYISAQNGGTTGCVTVEIRVRNTSYRTTQSCGAFVIATASGTVE